MGWRWRGKRVAGRQPAGSHGWEGGTVATPHCWLRRGEKNEKWWPLRLRLFLESLQQTALQKIHFFDQLQRPPNRADTYPRRGQTHPPMRLPPALAAAATPDPSSVRWAPSRRHVGSPARRARRLRLTLVGRRPAAPGGWRACRRPPSPSAAASQAARASWRGRSAREHVLCRAAEVRGSVAYCCCPAAASSAVTPAS